MNDNITIDQIASRFVTMSAMQRHVFLATYAHEITILARGHFVEKEFESARKCNETLHRVVGYLTTLLLNPQTAAESSFIEMLIAGAAQKGWSQILLRAVQMAS